MHEITQLQAIAAVTPSALPRSVRWRLRSRRGLLLLAIAAAIAAHGKAEAQSEQCQVPDAPTKQGDCYIASNPNPEGTLCTYIPYFISPRFKLTRSGDDYLYPGARNSRLICDRTDGTLEFFKWMLAD